MTTKENNRIQVEVVYGLPERQSLVHLDVAFSDTIEQIIKASGILKLHPEIELGTTRVGIFSKLAKLTDTLYQGDRIEIYRPLIADPKEVRKQRALKSKESK